MKITIYLERGKRFSIPTNPTRLDMDKNIKAIDHALQRNIRIIDDVRLIDTKSILMAIREQLPK